jgi:hypothetical protein
VLNMAMKRPRSKKVKVPEMIAGSP